MYDDWLKDFCSHYPDRQMDLACLPYGSVERAVEAVHRVAKMGLKGLELSCSWDMEPIWHPSWEPFWQAVDEVRLPLHFHTFPTTPPRARQEPPKVRRAAMFTGVSAFQMGLIHIIAGMMGAGVFERYPRLRVSFGESGAGWLAYALHRMDFEFEDRFRDLMKLRPSEYWRRQCKATFQFDPISAKLIDEIGVETMMWGSALSRDRAIAVVRYTHRYRPTSPAINGDWGDTRGSGLFLCGRGVHAVRRDDPQRRKRGFES
jgi:predicted TIM-barrel fold metal-dependent hydrolase